MTGILVTGANSFTARHLLPLLRAGSAPVRGTDLGPGGPPGLEYVGGDITDGPGVRRILESTRPSVVYHLAGVSTSQRDLAFAVNLEGTRNLLSAASGQKPAPTVVFLSSAAVYGRIRPEDNPVREDTELRPVGAYGESKAAAEASAFEHHRAGKVPVIVIRPFNLIGPGLPRGLAPADFAAEAARVRRGEGAPAVRVGSLAPRRDFVDVRDAVRAYTLLAARTEATGRAFNVGTGEATSIGDLLRAILESTGVEPAIETDPAKLRSVEVEEMVADTTALRSLTGWQPRIRLLESVRDMTVVSR